VASERAGTYTFANQPRAVPPQRKAKYRDEENSNDNNAIFGNIMYDRRVVRGNTYAQHVIPATAQPDPIEIQRQHESKRRALAKKRAKQQLRPRSPEPVEGRKHIDVQTELYLEELSDRVEEADVDVQTDAFLDRPPSPMFVPAKTGTDIATQIMKDDLFDFDLEVKPILEVLVGKTVEQALLEVMEEEELANMRAQQRAFLELRNAELVEQQRLEEQERRHRLEKEERMKQQREILRKEKETADKIAARAFAQSYLADLVPSVFGTLADNGYFYDPVERDIEQGLLPWLSEEVAKNLGKSVTARTLLDHILHELIKKRSSAWAAAEAAKKAAEEAEKAAQEALLQTATSNNEDLGTDLHQDTSDLLNKAEDEAEPEEAPPEPEAPETEADAEPEPAEEP
jgi:hypothetical protein